MSEIATQVLPVAEITNEDEGARRLALLRYAVSLSFESELELIESVPLSPSLSQGTMRLPSVAESNPSRTECRNNG